LLILAVTLGLDEIRGELDTLKLKAEERELLAQGDCDSDRAEVVEADKVRYADMDRSAELDGLVIEEALRVPDEHLLGNGDGEDERLEIGERDMLGEVEVLFVLSGVPERVF